METIEFNEVIKQNIEVVGGLLGNPLSEKGSITSGGDANNYIESGIFGVNAAGGSLTNFPPTSGEHLGELIVFKSAKGSALTGAPILQLYVDYILSFISVRVKWVNSWGNWKKLQFAQ